jgi:hypothetical protein
MMNSFPVKFQQAESDKRNICRSKEGVRETTAAVRTQQSRTAKTGAHSPQQRSTATTERNRRDDERRNRIG